MFTLTSSHRYFLYDQPTDMRKSFDGLAIYVQTFLNKNPLTDGLFIFRNKNADKVKLLYWHRNGLMIVYKRVEKGRFQWPVTDNNPLSLTRQDLELLLDGVDPSTIQRLPALTPGCKSSVFKVR